MLAALHIVTCVVDENKVCLVVVVVVVVVIVVQGMLCWKDEFSFMNMDYYHVALMPLRIIGHMWFLWNVLLTSTFSESMESMKSMLWEGVQFFQNDNHSLVWIDGRASGRLKCSRFFVRILPSPRHGWFGGTLRSFLRYRWFWGLLPIFLQSCGWFGNGPNRESNLFFNSAGLWAERFFFASPLDPPVRLYLMDPGRTHSVV